jgi:hypothetical protein
MKLPTEFRLLRPDEYAESTLQVYLTVPVRDDEGCWSAYPVAAADMPLGTRDELVRLATERARAAGRKVSG